MEVGSSWVPGAEFTEDRVAMYCWLADTLTVLAEWRGGRPKLAVLVAFVATDSAMWAVLPPTWKLREAK